MTRCRKKPVVIEAIRYTDNNWQEIQEWCNDLEPTPVRTYFFPVHESSAIEDPDVTAEVYDKLHSTWVGVKDGQWIIHGVQGEFYPCDAEVFEATYEVVDNQPGDPS